MKRFLVAASVLVLALSVRADDPLGTIVLDGKDAQLTGGLIRYQAAPDRRCIGFWNGMSNMVSWKVSIAAKKTYRVIVTQSCPDVQAGTEFTVSIANQQASGVVKGTGEWSKFTDLDLGPVMMRKAGEYELIIRPTRVARNTVMNLRGVKLVPEN